MKTGYCHSRKPGHDPTLHIVSEWKCVDIVVDRARPDYQNVMTEIRKREHYGVCEFCKDFRPDKDQPAATTQEKPGTPEKDKEQIKQVTGRFAGLDIL